MGKPDIVHLTPSERHRVAEIERHLAAEEPPLQRALAAMSLRPLRCGRLRQIVTAPTRRPGLRLAMMVVVLCAGVAALVAGELTGTIALLVSGALVSGIGPIAVCWSLCRQDPPREITGNAPAPAPAHGLSAPPVMRDRAGDVPGNGWRTDPDRPNPLGRS
jgi:hypothetical protein